jgi:hypothetical protein
MLFRSSIFSRFSPNLWKKPQTKFSSVFPREFYSKEIDYYLDEPQLQEKIKNNQLQILENEEREELKAVTRSILSNSIKPGNPKSVVAIIQRMKELDIGLENEIYLQLLDSLKTEISKEDFVIQLQKLSSSIKLRKTEYHDIMRYWSKIDPSKINDVVREMITANVRPGDDTFVLYLYLRSFAFDGYTSYYKSLRDEEFKKRKEEDHTDEFILSKAKYVIRTNFQGSIQAMDYFIRSAHYQPGPVVWKEILFAVKQKGRREAIQRWWTSMKKLPEIPCAENVTSTIYVYIEWKMVKHAHSFYRYLIRQKFTPEKNLICRMIQFSIETGRRDSAIIYYRDFARFSIHPTSSVFVLLLRDETDKDHFLLWAQEIIDSATPVKENLIQLVQEKVKFFALAPQVLEQWKAKIQRSQFEPLLDVS